MKLFQSSAQPKKMRLVTAIGTIVAATTCASTAFADKALEEVIVTAQKKDDTLQTVPMTVNAVTAETISKYNLLDFKDIQSVTPGLTIKANDVRTATIAMRGVNVLTDTGYGPGVAIYWNEVPTDIDSTFKSMFDIGQIEVLRGPQGTLRGVTAPAGAVTIMTKSPSFNNIEGTVEQTFGERDLSNTQFGMSLPIIEDRLALRIAGIYDHSKNDGITNVFNGRDNSSETRGGRFTLGLRATENIEATLTHQYLETTSAGNFAVEGCGLQSRVSGCRSATDREAVNQYQAITFNRRNDTSLRVEWNLDKYLLTSISGYLNRYNHVLDDKDVGNALPTPTFPGNGIAPANEYQDLVTYDRTFSQELRFQTDDADFYNWLVGAYGARRETNTTLDPSWSLLNFYADLGAYGGGAPSHVYNFAYGTTLPIYVFIPSVSEEYAIFTNHNFQFTDALEAQIGVRYQAKRVDQFVGVTTSSGTTQWGPKIATDEGVTGSASVSYQMTDDVRVYASYGRSFRSGGFTVAPSTPGQYTEYSPEISDSIELGFKSRFAGGRVQVNGAIYYQKYHDFLARSAQGVRTVHIDANPLLSTTGNDFLNFNADALSQGAELQVDALLTDDWQIGLGISYNDAKFTGGKGYCNLYDANGVVINPVPTGPGGTGDAVNTCAAKGRLSGEPNWGVTTNSEYTIHLGDLDSYVRAQYSFSSGRSDDSEANSVLDTSSYGLWNLFVGLRDAKKAWEVSAWVKNLFDHQQVVRRTSQQTLGGTGLAIAPDGYLGGPLNGQPDIIGRLSDANNPAWQSGYRQVQILPERQFGITAKYNFSL